MARDAMRQMAERIQDEDFQDIYFLHNDDPADDPDGAGTAPGNAFVVPGLNPRAADADGIVGTILFPTVVTGAKTQLREDVASKQLGMPRDLNGDGNVDKFDHAGDYILLPMTVRLEWRGMSGDRSLVLDLLLVE